MKSRISTRLLLAFLLISLLPLTVLTLITFNQSVESLEQQVRTNLEAIAQSKSQKIESYVRERIRNTAAMARSQPVIQAVKDLKAHFDNKRIDNAKFMTADGDHRSMLKYLQETMDYTDLFLINPEGDIIFSVLRNEDFSSNLKTGSYKDSELARAFARAVDAQDASVSDYSYYQAANEPAAFIAAPVRDGREFLGLIAVQLRNKEFYATVNEYTGLGETGETVIGSLQGRNAMFLTPTRHDKFAAFKTRVVLDDAAFKPLQAAVQGQSGFGTALDYRGIEVLASWRYLPTLRWGFVVKLDALEANALIARQRITVLALGAGTLLLVVLAALLVARSISRPIEDLTAVVRTMTEGNLGTRVEVKSKDELGVLGLSFNTMAQSIQDMNTNLEQMVAERTATIKSILDNVQFGFLMVGPELTVGDGFSRSCLDLLGSVLRPGLPLMEVLGLQFDRNRDLYKEFLNQAFEDFLPEEMTLRQLPARVKIRNKTLAVSAAAVRDEAKKVKGLLFTIVDASDLERAEIETSRHKHLVRLLRELDSFKDFIDESRTRLELCRRFANSGDVRKLRAELHTLKGNSAAFDFDDIARRIHHMEDKSIIEPTDIDEISQAYKNFLIENYDVLQINFDDQTEESYLISRTQLQELAVQIPQLDPAHVAPRMMMWLGEIQYRSARTLLGALPEYAEQLATRLGKNVKVNIEGGDVGMDPEIMKPVIQSLVHLVRNAIDHGIEFPQERGNKPEKGSIVIETVDRDGAWEVTIRDDGLGINPDRVVTKAVSLGLIDASSAAKLSESEKYNLIFKEGLSTADEVTDISGRGVGMPAVLAAIKDAGGDLKLSSRVGFGTEFKIRIPKRSLKTGPQAAA